MCGACLPVGRTDRAGHPDLRLRVRTVRAVLYKAFFGEGAAVQAGEEIEVDQETYSAYMKHIESLNRIIEQAAKR